MPVKTLAAAASSGKSTDIILDSHDLLLGFAFSIWPDGSPGRCNEYIAKSLRADLLHVRGSERPLVGLQWEVFDALEDLDTTKTRASQFVPGRMVAGPALFEEADILDNAQLCELLASNSLPAIRRLAQCVATELGVEDAGNPADLRAALNRLLGHRRLFEVFDGFLELKDGDCSDAWPSLGPMGIEKRKLPTKGLYPRGVRQFQALHINRLLIETLIPNQLLRRTVPVDDSRALDYWLDVVDVRQVRSVWIYAHPAVRDLCCEKALAALRERGWTARDSLVKPASIAGWDATRTWDADSARVWCRSQENWDTYAAIVKSPGAADR